MTAKLRILTGINRTSGPSSGSTIIVNDIYGAMPKFSTTFLGREPVDPAWNYSFDELIPLVTPKRPQGPEFDAYLARLTREVGALIEQSQPDVIHAQNPGFALSLALVRSAGSIPVISIAHGPEVIVAERDERDRELLHEVVAASAAVVAPTAALAGRIDQLTKRRCVDRITVIPWGISLDDIRVREYPSVGTGPLSLVYAGRLDANKSAVTGIEAVAMTSQPHRLTIIGQGPEEEVLRERTRALGIQDRVKFVPFLPRQELWLRFHEFDALVFTTAGSEAFGLVAIEAQAHGLPVVYANLSGMAETLRHAGSPFTASNPASLASALDELARDAYWRNALVRAGLDNARRYDITSTAKRLAALTTSVAGVSTKSAPDG
ncbi:glycosyltransferase family 4 protein [Kitasatospora sp. NPDC057940]|uniref:glycosyltransferase family 4 protein n=1 Tax=Kitasatospora sp. NPDC057940 TaxID=3346285 RepID=UPI0036DC36DA